MSKKQKKMKFKSFSDIPQGAVTDPQSHPANNLALRGSVPLGQSGETPMSPVSQEPEHTGNL